MKDGIGSAIGPPSSVFGQEIVQLFVNHPTTYTQIGKEATYDIPVHSYYQD
jgi:hypothetical protein